MGEVEGDGDGGGEGGGRREGEGGGRWGVGFFLIRKVRPGSFSPQTVFNLKSFRAKHS